MAKNSGKGKDEDYYDDDYQEAPRNGGMSTMLIVGLVFGGVCLLSVPVIAIVAAIAIPNLIEAKKHGNEASAIGSLKTIVTAQALYREQYGNGSYGSLEELGKASYIDSVLRSGMKQEYRFELGTFNAQGQSQFWVKASPDVPGKTGDRHFFVDSTGIVYFSLQDFTVNRQTGKPDKKLTRIGY